MMNHNYEEYRNLSDQQKKSRVQDAVQEEHHSTNPQGHHQFHQYSWIDFYVDQDGQKIKLETFRHNVREGQQVKGVIFMFHGLNSHMGHGAHLAEYFSLTGFITVGFDYRGFGRSEGRGGYVQNLEAHLKDCRKFVETVSPIYKNIPKFALGLSMGGMTSYHLALNNPQLFNGCILMAPALMNNIGGFLVKMTGILSKFLPKKSKLLKPIYGKASRNPTISQFVQKDKYAFSDRMSLSTIQMIVSTMNSSPETFKNFKTPFMVIQGGCDKLVNPEVAFSLYDNSATLKQDKQLLFYEKMWHDIWHEPEINQIMERISQWIHKQIKKKSNDY